MREALMTAQWIGNIHDTVATITAPLSYVLHQVMEVCGGIRYIGYIDNKIMPNLSQTLLILFCDVHAYAHTYTQHTHVGYRVVI